MTDSKKPKKKLLKWTREETILVLDFFENREGKTLKSTSQKFKDFFPEVIRLAKSLNYSEDKNKVRTEGSVWMRLRSFHHLDCTPDEKPFKNPTKLSKIIWGEYKGKLNKLKKAALKKDAEEICQKYKINRQL